MRSALEHHSGKNHGEVPSESAERLQRVQTILMSLKRWVNHSGHAQRWASSICSALLEHQLLSNAELGVELGADDSEAKPRPLGAVWEA